jgi:hypothetical protein
MTTTLSKTLRTLALPTLLGATLFVAGPGNAAADGLTFRGLEHRYAGQARMAAAHEHFNSVIPAATPLHEARATLERAGARCQTGETLTCSHHSFDGVDNMLHQVVWTVEAQHKDGAVTGLDIQRQSIGS